MALPAKINSGRENDKLPFLSLTGCSHGRLWTLKMALWPVPETTTTAYWVIKAMVKSMPHFLCPCILKFLRVQWPNWPDFIGILPNLFRANIGLVPIPVCYLVSDYPCHLISWGVLRNSLQAIKVGVLGVQCEPYFPYTDYPTADNESSVPKVLDSLLSSKGVL